MLALIALVAGGFASDIPTYPGLSLTLPPCEVQADAGCWEAAAQARRFAGPRGEGTSPIELDVRLAQRDGALLARVDGLPPGAELEISVDGKKPSPGLREAHYIRTAEHVVTLPAELIEGAPRSLRLAVLVPDGSGLRPLFWAPRGDGEPYRPAMVLPVADLGPEPEEPIVSLRDGMLMIEAEGAFQISLREDRAHQHPSLPREAGRPWQLVGEPPMLSELPVSGAYELVATYGSKKAPQRRISRVFEWTPPPPVPLQAHGIVPAPRKIETRRGAFDISPRSRIVLGAAEWAEAATLLADELERFTGARPNVVEGPPRRGDLWLGRLSPEAPVAGDWPGEAPVSEGFALRITPGLAAVGAPDLRGAIYGALALADALGPDGRSAALQATDWPEHRTRVLSHRLDSSRGHIDVEFYRTFLRRVVARGRYNTLVLILRTYYEYETVPELGRKRGWSRTEVEAVLQAARELGMEVIPGTNAPFHAEWILGAHPELAEGDNKRLLCTRHPELWPLLSQIYGELIDVFGEPAYFHVGHDEVFWRTERRHPVDRCPRCEGTPRYVLMADDITRHLDFFSAQGITPLFWSDTLVEGWSGKVEGLHRALDRLPESARSDAVFVGWSSIGDSVGTLSAAGFRPMYVMTGAPDVRRRALTDLGPAEGVGLALWTPVPWSAFGPAQDSHQPRYHFSQIIIVGASAWDPRLAGVTAETFLTEIADTPALRPGYQHVDAARATPLTLTGPASDLPVVLPRQLDVGALRFSTPTLIAAPREGLDVPIGARSGGLSLLQGVIAPADREKQLRKGWQSTAPTAAPPAAWLEIRWEDGEEERFPLGFGMDTWNIDGDRRIQTLWGTAAATRLARSDDASEVRLWRWDWRNPRPQTPIESARVVSAEAGIQLLLAGAAVWAEP